MSQSRGIPPTPKLGSISLPDDNDSKISGGFRKRFPSIFGRSSTPVPRSMTPVPVSVARCEYPASAEYSRPRATSLTSQPHIVTKPSSSKVHVPVPKHPQSTRGGSSKVQQYPNGSGFATVDHTTTANTWMNRYPKAISRPPSAAGKHEGPNTPRYMKAKIKEVPLKEEAIALSWPLVRYADRKKSKHHGPLLYYDAAFDPKDVANVKDNRRVHFLPLPHDDRELPVSTHCKLTEMIIDCPHVGQLIVTNPNGLRCIDVLNAIYLKYQKKPRSGEMPADTTRYMASFAQRCEDCPGLAEFNKKQGFRRIDLLKGKRIFDGLKRSASGHWELMFDAPSPRT